MQKQKEIEPIKFDVDLSMKEEKVEQIENKESTRVVRLKYESYCGCGYSTKKIERIVPYNSPLKNGDQVYDLEEGDSYGWN